MEVSIFCLRAVDLFWTHFRNPVISEYKNFSLSPAISALHYGIQVYIEFSDFNRYLTFYCLVL